VPGDEVEELVACEEQPVDRFGDLLPWLRHVLDGFREDLACFRFVVGRFRSVLRRLSFVVGRCGLVRGRFGRLVVDFTLDLGCSGVRRCTLFFVLCSV